MNILWKILYKLVAAAILGTSFFLGWYWLQYDKFVATPMLPPNHAPVIVELKPKTTVRSFANELTQANLIPNPQFFVILARLHEAGSHLKAGEYEITSGMRPDQFLERLIKGEVVQHQITFIEGWRLDQLLAALASNPYLNHLLTSHEPAVICQQLQIPRSSLEGQFFPDTYEFPKGMTDVAILKTAYQKTQTLLQSEWLKRSPDLMYQTPAQALIVASLIEKETAVDHERPMIAGVINRRLKIKMPLQIDAAVIYGLGARYTGVITKADLKLKTPYNTYLFRGLPPTPIAMPSLASIKAAMTPVNHEYLYYVAKGDGSHTFSKNLADHHLAVKEYASHVKHITR